MFALPASERWHRAGAVAVDALQLPQHRLLQRTDRGAARACLVMLVIVIVIVIVIPIVILTIVVIIGII